MSEQSEFEEWFSKYGRRNVVSKMDSKAIWQACAERKDKEIAVLRETYRYLIAEQSTRVMPDAVITHILIQGGIIDENGNPTKLLTGEKE